MVDQKIIDLTQTIHQEMPGVKISSAKKIDHDGWNASTLSLYSHSGTHMDAPLHFNVNDQTIDLIPPNRLISTAWIVNIPNLEPAALLTIEHLYAIKDKVQPGESVILKTGWSEKVGTPAYRNELPRISESLAHWLGEKKVNILAVEPPSVADVNNINEVTKIHEILMQHDIIIVEGICNLNEISSEKVTLIAMPLKVKNGDGAPARIVALES